MHRPALALIAACLLAPAAAAQQGDPVGLWRTPTDGGQVRISRCGPALCGTVVSSARLRANPDIRDANNSDTSLRSRRMQGLQILRGFTGGPTEWGGGSVYNPQDGRTYRGTITVRDANTLRLRGCVVAPLCRTQTWTRVR